MIYTTILLVGLQKGVGWEEVKDVGQWLKEDAAKEALSQAI